MTLRIGNKSTSGEVRQIAQKVDDLQKIIKKKIYGNSFFKIFFNYIFV